MFGIFEDDFPFPQVGYVNFLEGIFPTTLSENWDSSDFMTQTCLVFRAKVRGFSLDGTDPLPAEVVARTGISKRHGYI